LHQKTELIESTLYPGLDDAQEQFIDTFDEMENQLEKEMDRIKELSKKLDSDAGMSGRTLHWRATRDSDHVSHQTDGFFMIESEPALENVDVMTNATTAVTGFTRFTAAKSAKSAATGTSKYVLS
jgi:elongator complex protein 1